MMKISKNFTLLICLSICGCDSAEFSSAQGRNSTSTDKTTTSTSSLDPKTLDENENITFGGEVGSLAKSGLFDIRDGEICSNLEQDESKNKADNDLKGRC
jgi:hypothetical protein